MWATVAPEKWTIQPPAHYLCTWINNWEVVFMKFDVNDIVGNKYGRLTVIKFDHSKPVVLKNGIKNGFRYFYLCQCECGAYTITSRNALFCGESKSCGCYRKEQAYKANYKLNKYTNTRLYGIWIKAKQRCNNPNNHAFKNYGGRGITMCKEWFNNSKTFIDWAMTNGYQENLTLDRIDVNGNYEPNNCRWVDMKTQCNNKRNNHNLTFNGETHTIKEWAAIIGIKRETLRNRINYFGWSIEKALTTPLKS